MVTKEQRQAKCIREAYELARSGRHIDYLTIENALSDRYPEARIWLDRNSIRDDLRRECARARKKADDAQGS